MTITIPRTARINLEKPVHSPICKFQFMRERKQYVTNNTKRYVPKNVRM